MSAPGMPNARLLLLALALCLLPSVLWGASLTILATGDMHGWLEPRIVDGRKLGGAAEMAEHWRKAEGFDRKSFLVVSCGDIATGPAISTVCKGESAVKTMNMMGYDVSALGNHEFDFGGAAGLLKLQKWASFPFIAGNIAKSDGSPADLTPGTAIFDKGGVKIGVVGLIVQSFPSICDAQGLAGLPYEETVRRLVPELRRQGAQVVIVAAHVPQADLCLLAGKVADLGIPLMFGGHSHEFAQRKVGGTWVVNSGEFWDGYSRVDLDLDLESGRSVVLLSKQVWLSQSLDAPADLAIKAEIEKWRLKVESEHGESLGYSAAGLDSSLRNLVTDSWLAECQPADISICNLRGLRQGLPKGEIRKLDLLGAMPFENSLLRLKLTGAQLKAYQADPGGEKLVYGGAVWKGGEFIVCKTGRLLDPDAKYGVLINSYLYNRSSALKTADPAPEMAARDWRAPIIEWLKKNPSDSNRPLETLIDAAPRELGP